MNRRDFLAMTSLALASGSPLAAAAQPGTLSAAVIPGNHPLQQAWTAWKTLCVTPEGRIIDGPQDAVSHSEGQGYGAALATLFGDVETFERIYAWTEANLAVRSDALLAWRWRSTEMPHVNDRNNASDGDLFYAWALVSMGRLMGRNDLIVRATDIARDLARTCIVTHPDGSGALLFLPAEVGFDFDGGYVLNPSYIMPRAMREVAHVTGISDLDAAGQTGAMMIEALAQSGLVPDWVAITANGLSTPPPRFSFDAGYEAIRVPLFAVWSGNPQSQAVARYLAAVQANSDVAGSITVFDRASGRPKEVSDDPGYQAVSGLVYCAATTGFGAPIPQFSTNQPYYPATLQLMSLVAQAEMYPKCVPL